MATIFHRRFGMCSGVLMSVLVWSLVFPPHLQAQSLLGWSSRSRSLRSSSQNAKQGTRGSLRLQKGFDSSMNGSSLTFKTEIAVAGYVDEPGTYLLPTSARLTDALTAAGGLGIQGSERRIEIRRGGKVEKVVDLVAFQVEGNLENNPYLQSGDLVFVPARLGAIKIVGAVRRPAAQELIGPKSLVKAIEDAGGFTVDHDSKEDFILVRIVDGKRKMEALPRTDGSMESILQDGDIVVVPSISVDSRTVAYETERIPGTRLWLPTVEESIYMVGGFARPGIYPFNPELTLDRYIAMAGGFNIQAKPAKMYIQRPKGEDLKVGSDYSKKLRPGDTVVLPEKSIPAQFWPSFILSVASFSLTVFLAVDRLKN